LTISVETVHICLINGIDNGVGNGDGYDNEYNDLYKVMIDDLKETSLLACGRQLYSNHKHPSALSCWIGCS
jgi:hypothetical protein